MLRVEVQELFLHLPCPSPIGGAGEGGRYTVGGESLLPGFHGLSSGPST